MNPVIYCSICTVWPFQEGLSPSNPVTKNWKPVVDTIINYANLYLRREDLELSVIVSDNHRKVIHVI